MNRYVKIIVAIAAISGYFLILNYIAPSHEPYFILGIGLIGFIAWLYGTTAGLVLAMLMVPVTHHIYNQFTVSTSYLSFASSPAYIALELLTAVVLGRLRITTLTLSQKETALATANESLQAALSQVREFGGIHSLCTTCKKILDDDGTWKQVDTYLKEKTKAEFSHCICPDCAKDYSSQLANQKPADESAS
jgi:hypothetical protein